MTTFNYRLLIILTFLTDFLSIDNLAAQHILAGPYIIEPGNTAITIRWEMDAPGSYTMEFGKKQSKTNKEQLLLRGSKNGDYLYEVNLTSLKPEIEKIAEKYLSELPELYQKILQEEITLY